MTGDERNIDVDLGPELSHSGSVVTSHDLSRFGTWIVNVEVHG